MPVAACAHVCTPMYKHTYVHACMPAGAQMYKCMYTHTHMSMYACMQGLINCICMDAYI